MSSQAKNLQRIVESIEDHDSKCNSKAKAVLLSPYEHERLGWDSVKVQGRTVPIKPDESLGTGRLRVVCDGYHGPKKDDEIEDTVEARSPSERELVPAGMPSEDEMRSYIKSLGLDLTERQFQIMFRGRY